MKKTSISLLLIISSFVFSQQKSFEKSLQDARSAAFSGDSIKLNASLKLFLDDIGTENLKPQNLSDDDLDLLTKTLLTAGRNKLPVQKELLDKRLYFIKYEVKKKPYEIDKLGDYYLYIKGDKNNAEKYYKIGNEKGYLYSKMNLAYLYRQEKKYDLAIKIFESVSKDQEILAHSRMVAMHELAAIYMEIHKYPKAAETVVESRQIGIYPRTLQVSHQLAELYKTGNGIVKDENKAKYFYALACKELYTDSCTKLNEMLTLVKPNEIKPEEKRILFFAENGSLTSEKSYDYKREITKYNENLILVDNYDKEGVKLSSLKAEQYYLECPSYNPIDCGLINGRITYFLQNNSTEVETFRNGELYSTKKFDANQNEIK